MKETGAEGGENGWWGWRRWLPVLVLGAAIALFFGFGLHRHLDFDLLAQRYGEIEALRAAHPLVSALVGAAIYTAAIAISVPIGWMLAVSAGLVFGWLTGTAIALFSATLGAALLFVIARSVLEDVFRRRAGRWLNRFAEGFRKDAASYLLFLRLAPVIPFFLMNALPAVLGVRFRTFVWTTFVGIIPGTMAYTLAGDGLRAVIAERAEACAAGVAPCGEPVSPTDFVNPQIFLAFALLGLVALLPVVIRRFGLHKNGPTRP